MLARAVPWPSQANRAWSSRRPAPPAAGTGAQATHIIVGLAGQRSRGEVMGQSRAFPAYQVGRGAPGHTPRSSRIFGEAFSGTGPASSSFTRARAMPACGISPTLHRRVPPARHQAGSPGRALADAYARRGSSLCLAGETAAQAPAATTGSERGCTFQAVTDTTRPGAPWWIAGPWTNLAKWGRAGRPSRIRQPDARPARNTSRDLDVYGVCPSLTPAGPAKAVPPDNGGALHDHATIIFRPYACRQNLSVIHLGKVPFPEPGHRKGSDCPAWGASGHAAGLVFTSFCSAGLKVAPA